MASRSKVQISSSTKYKLRNRCICKSTQRATLQVKVLVNAHQLHNQVPGHDYKKRVVPYPTTPGWEFSGLEVVVMQSVNWKRGCISRRHGLVQAIKAKYAGKGLLPGAEGSDIKDWVKMIS